MEEKENKIVFTMVFAFAIILVVMYNNQKKNKLEKFKRYTIVKVLNAQVHGKNNTKYTFYFDGVLTESYSKLLWKNEREAIIGNNVLLKFDSSNFKNSEVLIDYKISDTIKSPIEGWKEIPSYIIKIDE